MAKIAFILLCHKDPSAIIQQARRLTATGDFISIHFDARADPAEYAKIRTALQSNPHVTFARKRIKCGWGEWSLVEATLQAIRAALEAFPRATHFYMVSGDCMAIKSAAYAHEFLDAEDVDYIESFDFFKSDWIKIGMKGDRLLYRHFFNERKNKALFYISVGLQRRLHLARSIPQDLQIMVGSQWWCLRRNTVERIDAFCAARADVMRFFRTTWIPDETFFQTLVPHLVPQKEIRSRTLTFLMFTDYGMPVTFYNDHYDLLLSQDFLFARKISSGATELKRRLGDMFASEDETFKLSNEGATLFKFLTGRGRIGRRFAPRFWETESTLGRERELLIVTCKKWHVAKRLLERIRVATGLPCLEYMFDEESTPMPDLGGLQKSIGKRTRHRRSLMRMLFEYYRSDRLVICLDPDNMDLLRDFYSDRSTTRLMEIQCEFTDDYLLGHAKRVGLAGERTPQDAIDLLLPALRSDIRYESEQIRDAGFGSVFRIQEAASLEENLAPLAQFLNISRDSAREILSAGHLFDD